MKWILILHKWLSYTLINGYKTIIQMNLCNKEILLKQLIKRLIISIFKINLNMSIKMYRNKINLYNKKLDMKNCFMNNIKGYMVTKYQLSQNLILYSLIVIFIHNLRLMILLLKQNNYLFKWHLKRSKIK